MRATFIGEIRRITRNGSYLATLTLLPVVALLFFALYFQDVNIHSLPIVVVDNDNSKSSRALIEMINATQSAIVDYQVVDYNHSLQLIQSGNAYAAVVIPEGFERNILRQSGATISLYNSGANISTNGFIAKDIQTIIATFNAAIELQSGVKMSEIMPIRVDRHLLFNPELNYASYLAPCFMPMMVMIFTLLGTVWAVAERKTTSIATLIGRCMPTTLAMILFAMVMLLLLFRALNIPLRGSSWMIIVATIVLIADYQAIAILFTAIFRSGHIALSIGGGYCVLAFTFSGLTFPTMAMAPLLQAVSHIFPFTYYMQIMVDQALRGAPIAISAAELGRMAIFLLLPILTLRRL